MNKATGDQESNFPKKFCQLWSKVKKFNFHKNSVTHVVENLFYQQGLRVSQHPNWFIVIPFIITLTLSCGVFKAKINLDVNKVLTPNNAYSNYEVAVFYEFLNDFGGLYYCPLIVTANDGGSMLREEYREEALRLFEYLFYNLSIAVGNQSYSFSKLQINHQDQNKLILSLLETFNRSRSFTLTHPVVEINSDYFFIGDIFRKVTVNPQTKAITGAKEILFRFDSSRGDQDHYTLLYKWSRKLLQTMHSKEFPKLNYYIWNDQLFAAEMSRQSWIVFPYIVLGFIVLIIFAFIVSASLNPVKSKPLEALSSIVAVLLACGTGLGIVFFCDIPFIAILTVVPVLVLALGMDVTYILLRAWRTTNPSLATDIRLAEALKESGPSIVITASTNILSAAIGCMTNTYMVYIFCLSLSVSVTTLFLLQVTFFPAFLYYGGKREEASRHGFLICCKVNQSSDQKEKSAKLEDTDYDDWWCKCSKLLAKLITTNLCRIIISLLMLLYWGSSIYFCYKTVLGLTPKKCLPSDSPLMNLLELEEDFDGGRNLFVFVSNPPNFSSPTNYQMFNKLVHGFESFPECIGSNATALWLRAYENYNRFMDDDTGGSFYDNLDTFLNTSSGRWRRYLKVERDVNNKLTIKQFMFTVVYARSYHWDVRTHYTEMWRSLADDYPQFNVTSWFDDNYNFLIDQLQSLPGNAIQDLVITLCCMAVICILFIPNLFSTVCALVTITSIMVGTYGYLMAWDVALDPISLSSLLLSIGYSVDFTSHITYHYYSSPGKNQQEKLYTALSSIGLPMIESGLSTVLCVTCLCFVNSYMVIVFVKNIFLVILLGLLHGLIILPMYLACIPLDCFTKLYKQTFRFSQQAAEPKTAVARVVSVS